MQVAASFAHVDVRRGIEPIEIEERHHRRVELSASVRKTTGTAMLALQRHIFDRDLTFIFHFCTGV